MPEVTSSGDQPSGSVTDRAANAGLDAIDGYLREHGQDSAQAWKVVMVMVPGGKPENATVAGALPGEVTTERLLDHALTQLQMIATECGITITATRNRVN